MKSLTFDSQSRGSAAIAIELLGLVAVLGLTAGPAFGASDGEAIVAASPDHVAAERPPQPIDEIEPTEKNTPTVEILTDHGVFRYHIDNSGDREVSAALQEVFDRVSRLEDVSATFRFLPGVYFVDHPLSVRLASVELVGSGHRGIDIHGMNLKSGSVFWFGENCGPNCVSFLPAGHTKSFPAGETPWKNQNSKVGLRGMTFVGHNNTGVDTAAGYSRFRGDKPNFRGLSWYPAPGRYDDVERDGQRAIVIAAPGGKREMLSVDSCVFTDLYVGIETASMDVGNITNSWFAQMTYGLRMRGSNPVLSIENNCFADLETGVTVSGARMANFNSNGFAYVSKCFDLRGALYSTLSHNTVDNWEKSTGAAAFGAFCFLADSNDVVLLGNSVRCNLDARAKTRTIDQRSNGRAFVHFERCRNLLVANNTFDTRQSQTVVRLHEVTDSAVIDNLIRYGKGGNAVAETGACRRNLYRPLDPDRSAPFDPYVTGQ